MRVYFSGAESSGKTTLARYASEKYKLPLLNETARIVLSANELQIDTLRADIELADKYQLEVFHRQILEEKKYDSFCADRSAIDCIAYSCQYSRIGPTLISDPIFKQYIEGLKNQILFFVRPAKEILKNDGVRENVVWENALAIDSKIQLLLEMYNIRYFSINTSSAQQRVRLIDAVMSLVAK